MRASFGFITVFIASLFCPTAGLAAEIGWTDVTVRVYNATELPASELRAALDVASATLAAADVEITWRDCSLRTRTRSACDAPIALGELAIRLVHSPAGSTDARLMALGDALVDAHAGHAVLGTLYVDRVHQLAAAAGADAPLLLGRAIAHELGHLLVATSVHSKFGLMRAVWSKDEVQLGRKRDWEFTKSEVAAIRGRNTTMFWGTR